MGRIVSNIFSRVKTIPLPAIFGLVYVGLVSAALLLPLTLNSRANQLCDHDGGMVMITGNNHVICEDYKAYDYATGKYDPLNRITGSASNAPNQSGAVK